MSTSLHVEWNNITFRAKNRQFNWNKLKFEEEELTILNDVTGRLQSGELCAVLGPSGSGKTTLLALISQRHKGHFRGEIRCNGHPITRQQMTNISGFIPQHDIKFEYLTAREHLWIMSEFKLKLLPWQSRSYKINEILFKLGLGQIADSKISTLSGGECKKLNLATELLSEPSIIFCDEPTTGLDSYSALSIISSLKQLTQENKRNSYSNGVVNESSLEMENFNKLTSISDRQKAIMCSIHQPTSEVFECFSHVILMSAGEVVFQGSTEQANHFFSRFNLYCPSTYCPAEFYVQAISDQELTESNLHTNMKRVSLMRERFRSEWKSLDFKIGLENLGDIKNNKKISWFRQVYILSQRSAIQSRRNKNQNILQLIIYLFAGVVMSMFYCNVTGTTQSSVQDVRGALFYISLKVMIGAAYSVIVEYPSNLPLIRKEAGEQLYSLSAYYVATILSRIPKMLIECLSFLGVLSLSLKFLRDIWLFLKLVPFVFLTAFTSTAYGYMLSSFSESYRVTVEVGPAIDVILIVLSGFYINLDEYPNLRYLSMFYYSNEGVSYYYWSGVTYISCDDTYSGRCLRNGTDVLERFSYKTGPTTIINDIYGLLTIAFICYVIGYLGVRRFVNKIGYY